MTETIIALAAAVLTITITVRVAVAATILMALPTGATAIIRIVVTSGTAFGTTTG